MDSILVRGGQPLNGVIPIAGKKLIFDIEVVGVGDVEVAG